MRCPQCQNEDTKVVDSREANENREIRRRRECLKCQYRFTTFERLETADLIVIKKDHSREPYDRKKLENGIWKACQKRLVTQAQVDQMISELETEWTAKARELESRIIGEGVMRKLKEIDEVAYIRFASVYRSFENIETFHQEIGRLVGAK